MAAIVVITEEAHQNRCQCIFFVIRMLVMYRLFNGAENCGGESSLGNNLLMGRWVFYAVKIKTRHNIDSPRQENIHENKNKGESRSNAEFSQKIAHNLETNAAEQIVLTQQSCL